MIKGGYYLKARKIQESAIARMPPHVREIWDWLLMKAMFTDGIHLQRGQVLASYDDIREGLHWFVGWRKMMYSKWDCEKAMKVLMKATMITTQKTTRGLIITILNYSEYQDPKNYESHTESHRKATRKPQTTDTIDKNDKNYKNVNTNIEDFVLPQNIKPETWSAYLEMRKVIKKPATPTAQKLVLKKLATLPGDPNLILEQSIQNSWQGVFELKGVTNVITTKEYIPDNYQRPTDDQVKRNIERANEIVKKLTG